MNASKLIFALWGVSFLITNGCASSKKSSYKDWEPPALEVNDNDDDDDDDEEDRYDQRTQPRKPARVRVEEEDFVDETAEVTTHVKSAEAKLVEINDDVKPDPDVVAMLAPFKEDIEKRVLRVVGILTGPLERGRGDSTLGNFVTDAMRSEIERNAGERADVCFTNNGGLRRDIPKGKVTEGTLVELMPFDNAIVVFEMSGKKLKRVLKRVARRGDPASGLKYGEGDFMLDGRSISDGANYTVCTNDYLFEGGGGYKFKGATDVRYTGILLRDVIIAGFEREHKNGRKVKPLLDGRAPKGDGR